MEKIFQEYAAHLQRIHFALLSAVLLLIFSLLSSSSGRLNRAVAQAELLKEYVTLVSIYLEDSVLGGKSYTETPSIQFYTDEQSKLLAEIDWPEVTIGTSDKGMMFRSRKFEEDFQWAEFSTLAEAEKFFKQLLTVRRYHIERTVPVRIVSRENKPIDSKYFDMQAKYNPRFGPYVYSFYPKKVREFTYPHALVRLKLNDKSVQKDKDFFGILNLDGFIRRELGYGFTLLNSILIEKGAKRLPVGTFEQALPDLYAETKDINSLTVEQAASLLQKRLDEKQTIKLLGLDISITDIGRIGLPIIIILQLYFLVHFRELVTLVHGEKEPLHYPWVVLFSSRLSKIMTMVSVCILPIILPVMFVVKFDNALLHEVLLFFTALFISAAISIMTIRQLTKYWKLTLTLKEVSHEDRNEEIYISQQTHNK